MSSFLGQGTIKNVIQYNCGWTEGILKHLRNNHNLTLNCLKLIKPKSLSVRLADCMGGYQGWRFF